MKAAAGAATALPLAQIVLAVAAATLAQTVASMGSSMLPVIAPKIADEFAIDPAWIGMQVSIVYACGALSGLLASGMVRRLGACRAIQIALGASAAGSLIAAIPSIATIALGSALLGAGIGIVHPPSAQLMLRFSPPTQINLVFSIKQTGVPLGITLSALIAPVVAVSFGWQWALMTVVALALVLLSVLEVKRNAWDGDRDPAARLIESPISALNAIWRQPQLRYVVLAGAAFSAVQVCVSTFAVTMLVGEIGHGLVQAGLLMSIVTVAGVSARLGFGWLADRLRSGRTLLGVMGAGMIACCLLLGSLDSRWSLAAVTALFIGLGVFMVGWNGILHAEVARMSPPGGVSLAASGVSFLVYAAVAVTPSVAALIYRVLGSYGALFAVLPAFAVAGLCLLWASARAARGSHP